MSPTVFTNYVDGKISSFLGVVKVYHGSSVEYVKCTKTRKNRLKSLEDAKRLLQTLRKV